MTGKPSIPRIIIDAALAACCAIATVCVVPTAFGAPFRLNIALIVVLALALSAAVHLTKKAWPLPCVLLAVLLTVYYDSMKEKIIQGAKIVWYSAVGLLSLDFSFLPTPKTPEVMANPELAVAEFMMISAAAIVIVAVILLAKCRTPIPAVILPLPVFAVGFIYIDCPPALWVVLLMLIYWAGALFFRDREGSVKVRSEWLRAVFIVSAAAVACLIPVIKPESSYTPIPFSERRAIMDAIGAVRDNMLAGRMSNPRQYDLASESARFPSSEKVFSFNCSTTGRLYLRMHSYGPYTGTNWDEAEEYDGDWCSMQVLGSRKRGDLQYACIRDAEMSERLTPYAFRPDEELKIGESTIKANGRTAYVWTYYSNVDATPDYTTMEEIYYYNFALQNYTLPEGETRTRMLSLIEDAPFMYRTEWRDTEAQFGAGSIIIIVPTTEPVAVEKSFEELRSDPYGTALAVADYVKNIGEYTLDPGKTPLGSDFVEYFMKENRKGYCVHYASATTAILQALGIPARFVVGYCVEVPTADVWLSAEKNSAHAWTEVYVKGAGWLPVESTASFSSDIGISMDEPAVTEAPVETIAPERTHRPIDDDPTPTTTPRPTRVPVARPSVSPSVTEAPSESIATKVLKSRYLYIALGLIAAFLLWQIVGAVVKARRKRRFEQENANAAVLAMVPYLCSLRRYGGIVPKDPDGIMDEAEFSHHNMEKRKQEMLEFVELNEGRLGMRNRIVRFVLRRILFKI